MKAESIEQFLSRGGKINKSDSTTSLDQLLYNEGLLNHEEAKSIKTNISDAITSGLYSEFPIDNKPS